MQRMLGKVHGVFGTFLRGQLLLMLSIFLMTAIVLSVVGLRHALPLALIAAFLEIIPIIGPIVAAVPAVVIAVFQEPTPLGLSGVAYPMLIIGVYVLIQQTENHLLVPNIIGRSAALHPAAVVFAVLAGATIGGLLGGRLVVPLLWAKGSPAPGAALVAKAAPVPAGAAPAPPAVEQVRS